MLAGHVRENIPPVMHSEKAFLFVLDRGGSTLRLVQEEERASDTGAVSIALDDKAANRGLVGACFEGGHPIRTQQPAHDERYNESVDGVVGYQPNNLLCVPVQWRPPSSSMEEPVCLGVLGVINKVADEATSDWYSDNDTELLQEISTYVATAIKNAQEHEEDSVLLSVSQAVHEVAAPVLNDLWDPDMPSVVKAVREVVCCDIAQVFCAKQAGEAPPRLFTAPQYFSQQGGSLKDVAQGGWSNTKGVASGEGAVGACFQTVQSISIPNCYADDRFNATVDQKGGVQCMNMLCVPITVHTEGSQKVIGVFQMYNKRVGDGFDEFDAKWARAFASDVLSIAITNLKALHPSEDEAS